MQLARLEIFNPDPTDIRSTVELRVAFCHALRDFGGELCPNDAENALNARLDEDAEIAALIGKVRRAAWNEGFCDLILREGGPQDVAAPMPEKRVVLSLTQLSP